MIGILGGGLAGLTVAAHLDGPCEVLEAAQTAGGHCRSVSEHGCTFDAGGPHIIFSTRPHTLNYMLELLGDNRVQGRRANRIWYRGRYVKYPFENGLYDLDPQERFECVHGFLFNDSPAPGNFAEWLRHTFGNGLTDKYLLPYNEKIWKYPASEMAIDWVDGRVPRPTPEEMIKSAVGVETEGYTHQLNFWYPRMGGIEALPRALARRVPVLTTGFRVDAVRREGKGWTVAGPAGCRKFDRLVCTLPLPHAARITAGVPESVRSAAAALRYNSLATVTLAFATTSLPRFTAIYVPDPGIVFHRLSFPAEFSAENAPEGIALVQAEVTYSGTGPSDADLLDQVRDGLGAMGLVSREFEPHRSWIIRSSHGYVVRDFDYSRNLRHVRRWFEEEAGIALCGRVAEFEYMNMDRCIERGIETARALADAAAAAGGR